MRASKFVNGINLDNNNKRYNPTNVFIDLDNSNMSELSDPKEPLTQHLSAKAIPTTVVPQKRTEDSDVFAHRALEINRPKLSKRIKA